jgi:DNA-directed RNA polymerase omega subunit
MAITLSRGPQLNNDTCVTNVGENRFDLVLIAAARSREIKARNRDSMKFEHIHPNVTALLEIQEGKVGREYLKKVR